MFLPADHYAGITENWTAGPIYCSHATARLIIHLLGVAPEWVHGLDMGTTHMIHGGQLHAAALCCLLTPAVALVGHTLFMTVVSVRLLARMGAEVGSGRGGHSSWHGRQHGA